MAGPKYRTHDLLNTSRTAHPTDLAGPAQIFSALPFGADGELRYFIVALPGRLFIVFLLLPIISDI